MVFIIAVLYIYCLFVGAGGPEASDGDVFPDSQWDEVPGIREIRPQRPGSQELHVSTHSHTELAIFYYNYAVGLMQMSSSKSLTLDSLRTCL